MSAQLPLLQGAPLIEPRAETVDVPRLGGSVQVRGLMAAELFACEALRSQAMRGVREARREHDQRLQSLPPGAEKPAFEAPELSFTELRAYGRYVSELLARAVTIHNGLALWTVEQWELADQHYPGVRNLLQPVAERLSGLDTEDVEKNSKSSPS